MTPIMRRFTAVLGRKGLAADWRFGAMPGSTAAAPVFLAQSKLQQGREENHVLAFDVSKAFDTAPHGALALLLRHMGVRRSSSSSCTPSVVAPRCALSLHRAPPQASASIVACGREARKVLCSIFSS